MALVSVGSWWGTPHSLSPEAVPEELFKNLHFRFFSHRGRDGSGAQIRAFLLLGTCLLHTGAWEEAEGRHRGLGDRGPLSAVA